MRRPEIRQHLHYAFLSLDQHSLRLAVVPFARDIPDMNRYEQLRNHPRLIMHVKSRLLSWSANCDTQPIVDQDLIALQNYLGSYACKVASTTEDLINVYRYLIESINEQNTVRNHAKRLLLKTVRMVDVPGAAADYINCGGKLLHCTRTFQNVGISADTDS